MNEKSAQGYLFNLDGIAISWGETGGTANGLHVVYGRGGCGSVSAWFLVAM